MVRNRRALLVALLCVLAVSLAAATLANPQQPAGGSGIGGSGPDPSGTAAQSGDGGDGFDNPEPADGEESFRLEPVCVPILATPTAGFAVFGFALLLGLVAYWRDGIVPAFIVVFVTSSVLFPAWLLLTNCSRDIEGRGGSSLIPELPSDPAPGGEAGGSAGSELLFSPPTVLLGLLAIAVLLGAVAFRATGDDEPPEREPVPEPAPAADDETLGALGNVAGDAADRIAADADVENEVYRAWREMTDHLDVANPEASTPAEFAAAASDVGMAREHVDELTDLFRSVRYGGAAVTADREQRAADALRAIEASYGGDG
ncbi:DUF4129 domain-containing protein [Halobacterium noricense]|uniref:DUF4129 domain-containing protein n=1 Tax=Halobacterium noricense TaxID=223182 RepID=UPI001E2E2EC5|nr:DUF4129 domain-containing protein [Halobacterium noricense]UHH25702.1 DUF4129 domain-containing protein [Halobacterium noricense]